MANEKLYTFDPQKIFCETLQLSENICYNRNYRNTINYNDKMFTKN